jgi:hypothetical protein
MPACQHVSHACMPAHSHACMLSTQHGSLPPPQYVTEGRACMLCFLPSLFLPPHPPLQSSDPDASDDGCPNKQPGSSSRKARRISSAGGAAAGGLAAFGGGISSSKRATHQVGRVLVCGCECVSVAGVCLNAAACMPHSGNHHTAQQPPLEFPSQPTEAPHLLPWPLSTCFLPACSPPLLPVPDVHTDPAVSRACG